MFMTPAVVQKLRANVRRTIEQYQMFENVRKVIIGFSTGPDSVCLLDALHHLLSGEIELEIVYVNHGLRSKSVLGREEQLLRRYAARYGLNSNIVTVKVVNKGEGPEAAARAARYTALLGHMKKISAQRIVLGHNLDDLVETFLLNVIRGSGLRGLGAMPASRFPIVRPLINCKKSDIMKYLKLRKLPYAVDETNRSLAFRRNLLRMRIVPVLEKINPEIHGAVKRDIEILKQDDAYLWSLAERAYSKSAHLDKDGVSLDLHRIVRYNPSLLNRMVMKAVRDLLGSLDGFESKHYHAIANLIRKELGKKIALPKGLYAQKERESVFIGWSRTRRRIAIAVDIGQRSLIIGNRRLRIRILKRWNFKKNRPDCEAFDLDEIRLPLEIRNRLEGDSIVTKIGRKKLKKVFNERKIAPRRRDDLLLLCDQVGILWIIGVARAFRGFVSKSTKRFLVVDFENIN